VHRPSAPNSAPNPQGLPGGFYFTLPDLRCGSRLSRRWPSRRWRGGSCRGGVRRGVPGAEWATLSGARTRPARAGRSPSTRAARLKSCSERRGRRSRSISHSHRARHALLNACSPRPQNCKPSSRSSCPAGVFRLSLLATSLSARWGPPGRPATCTPAGGHDEACLFSIQRSPQPGSCGGG
jgi:hypothetical protein